jgi:hypothetical protein
MDETAGAIGAIAGAAMALHVERLDAVLAIKVREFHSESQFGPNLPWAAPGSNRKVSSRVKTTVRKAEPDRVWQSAQWQIITFSGSISAS